MARKRRPSKSRPSKMGRKWTQEDVLTYNINIVNQDLNTFFGVTDLPFPDVEGDALTAENLADATSDGTLHVLFQMGCMTDPGNGTIDFVRELFNLVHYSDPYQKRGLRIGWDLTYLDQGGRYPKVDVSIMDEFRIFLLVVKVHTHSRGFDPEPRLISDAIAAFHNNNIMRVKRLGTNPVASQILPGIVMDGTMPTFYKIPITNELVRAVESGEKPELETVVHVYVPEVPRPEEGMKPLDNRVTILSCFEAFKQFL